MTPLHDHLPGLLGVGVLEAVVVGRRHIADDPDTPFRVVRLLAETEALLRRMLRDYRERRGEPYRPEDLEELLAWAERNLRGGEPAADLPALSELPVLPGPEGPPGLTEGGIP